MTVTTHSIERVKERIGLNQKRAERLIMLAMQRGKTADDYTSMERNYLKNKEKGECIAIVFAGYCFLVSYDGACKTIVALPDWFGKKKHFDGKERIRDYKKYCKSNGLY